jgi:Leucine-rich repeat (LRR) protein
MSTALENELGRPWPWTDGYVIATAEQMSWILSPAWEMLQNVDRGLKLRLFKHILERLQDADVPVFMNGRADLVVPPRFRPLVEELYELVRRVQSVGSQALDVPRLRHYHHMCTLDRPLMYMGMAHAASAPVDEVLMLSFGDFSHTDPDWLGRDTAARFRNLRALHISGHQLPGGSIGIDLARFPSLEVLDLGSCDLTRLPPEVRDLPSLRWLCLAGNPLTDVPDLTLFPGLEYVSFKRTNLSSASARALLARGIEVAF